MSNAAAKQDDVILELSSVTKTFGSYTAVNDVSLSVCRGEFVTLLGPSGCGKSTILRMIAGFETPTSGAIVMNGQDISATRPYERAVGLVFQSLALFPHMNVFDNVAFGLRAASVDRRQIESRVMEMLALVELADFAFRPVGRISGGQRQRVALARSLVTQPDVLLLDEPLSALDLKLRRQLQVELKRIQKDTGITFIFVTHDQEEALSMSDRIAVMNVGCVEQFSPAVETYHFPRTPFVAKFVGETNLLSGVVSENSDGGSLIEIEGFAVDVPLENAEQSLRKGDGVSLSIRPEHVSVSVGEGVGVLGSVLSHSFSGASVTYSIQTEHGEVLAQVPFSPTGPHPLPLETVVSVGWSSENVRVISNTTK